MLCKRMFECKKTKINEKIRKEMGEHTRETVCASH
jgi:hypothetical protein